METHFKLPVFVSSEVREGRLNCTVVFTKTGLDTWVRPTSSHEVLGINPNNTMTVGEAEASLMEHWRVTTAAAKRLLQAPPVSGSSAGTQAGKEDLLLSVHENSDEEMGGSSTAQVGSGYSFKPGSLIGSTTLTIVDDDVVRHDIADGCYRLSKKGKLLETISHCPYPSWRGMCSKIDYPKAIEVAARLGYDSVDNNGVRNLAPANSLCPGDFVPGKEGSGHLRLFVRATLVAQKLGATGLTARIPNNPLLRVSGVTTLEGWWAAAHPKQRIHLLYTGSSLQRNALMEDQQALEAMEVMPFPLSKKGQKSQGVPFFRNSGGI